MVNFQPALDLINQHQVVTILQAENPDADSLASAVALEQLLTAQGKEVYLYCPIDMPKYIRYIPGWDRVTAEFNYQTELIIIVDTASQILISKSWDKPAIRHQLQSKPVLVIDHHQDVEPDLTFEFIALITEAVATSELIYDLAVAGDWPISDQAANLMLNSISADTLGFTTPNVKARTFELAAALTELGANISQIETRRHDFNKKSPTILAYKGELIGRIDYHCQGKLATVHIPFEDIQAYSDQYNPSVLVLDEMRFVEGVEVAVAIKTYPDGKLTGKIRSNLPVANQIAGYFGGGGHEYAAGFRVYEDYDKIMTELITVADEVINATQKHTHS